MSNKQRKYVWGHSFESFVPENEPLQSKIVDDHAVVKTSSENSGKKFDKMSDTLSSSLSSSSLLSGSDGEMIDLAGTKVAEIIKNPVNVDLNKLPSEVIEKIAEGGVTTTPKIPKNVTSETTNKTIENVSEESIATTTPEVKQQQQPSSSSNDTTEKVMETTTSSSTTTTTTTTTTASVT
ncbi:conserved hypothetical protein [Pediculus humanus corporis]|uniref:Uncharacterized protein n=1 Tax=Pediculus humanus subsp. corporis TaxID=121224 RepID=E0V8X2_PEDHC|nr:uncharacterized protein Phum_PHUM000900 [Pediculus humanus corporis]EEB09828.1 conserved hypothetical protein [Pediculus humanus corporis]